MNNKILNVIAGIGCFVIGYIGGRLVSRMRLANEIETIMDEIEEDWEEEDCEDDESVF